MNTWTPNYWDDNNVMCCNFVKDVRNWKCIPYLDELQDLTLYENKLVRFRCMVQDIRDPLFYAEKYEIKDLQTGEIFTRYARYGNFIRNEEHEIKLKYEKLISCERVFGVEIPGLNEWAAKQDYNRYSSYLTLDEDIKRATTSNEIVTDNRTASQSKTSYEDYREQNKRFCSFHDALEKQKCDETESRTVHGVKSSSCFIMLYDVNEGNVKLNDVIDVIGFLRLASENTDDCPIAFDNLETRIDAVACIPYTIPIHNITSNEKELITNAAPQLREELWLLFCRIFAGDTLAVDYIICYLFSSAFIRNSVDGHFSINISNVPCQVGGYEYAETLYKIISTLVPKSRYFSLTIDNLNTSTLIPRKNYVTEKLDPGLLQLSSITNLVIDETKLNTGQLNPKGFQNFTGLRQIIESQRLIYDFEFSAVSFNTDVPILCLSQHESILKFPIQLSFKPDSSCLEEMKNAFEYADEKLNGPLLNKLRTYIEIMRGAEYSIPTEMQQFIADDYADKRQERSINPSDLNMLLVIARFFSLSKGRNTLDVNDWKHVCEMERIRKQRII